MAFAVAVGVAAGATALLGAQTVSQARQTDAQRESEETIAEFNAKSAEIQGRAELDVKTHEMFQHMRMSERIRATNIANLKTPSTGGSALSLLRHNAMNASYNARQILRRGQIAAQQGQTRAELIRAGSVVRSDRLKIKRNQDIITGVSNELTPRLRDVKQVISGT